MGPKRESNQLAVFVGGKIAEARGDEAQASFAKSVGCGLSTLRRYEDGERLADLEFLIQVAEKTGRSVNYLISGEDAPADLLAKGIRDEALRDVVAWVLDFWSRASVDQQAWLREQLRRAVPEFAEWERSYGIRGSSKPRG